MIQTNLSALELTEFTGITDNTQHCRATFPLLGAHGTRNLASVYFELEPGDRLGRHTDSAEELLIVLEGTVEIIVGDETATGGPGHLAIAPEMVPHDLRNVGTTKARILGVFGGANHIVATFDNHWLPLQSNTVDTSRM